jgi:nucleoside phosphorylase
MAAFDAKITTFAQQQGLLLPPLLTDDTPVATRVCVTYGLAEVFIHFLHEQLLSLYGVKSRIRPHRDVVRLLREALRLTAFASPDVLVMPSTDIVQSSVVPGLLSDLQLLADSEVLFLVGSTMDVDQLLEGKRAHLTDTSYEGQWQYPTSRRRLRTLQPVLQARNIDTTADVKSRWTMDVAVLAGGADTDGAPASFPVRELHNAYYAIPSATSPAVYEKALQAVPERLGSHAFLWRVVEDLKIFDLDLSPEARRRVELALGWNWAMGYLTEYRTTMVGRIPRIGIVDCGISSTSPDRLVDLVAYRRALKMVGLLDAFENLSLEEIVTFRDDLGVVLLRDGLVQSVYDNLTRPSTDRAESLQPLARFCAEARDAAQNGGSARAVVENVARAVVERRARSASVQPTAQPEQDNQPATVLVVLALAEEAAMVLRCAEETLGPLAVLEDPRTGHVSYEVRWRTARGQPLRMLFTMVGKGQEQAAAAAAGMLADFPPCIVANVGIAGSLSPDLAPGDVLMADQIVSYLENARAESDGQGSFRLRMAGIGVRPDEYLTHRARQLPFVAQDDLARAGKRLAERFPGDPTAFRDPPLVIGPLACGPVVAASRAFTSWLQEHKRDLAAIDMESSGIAAATAASGMLKRVRFVALRGISDAADEDKSELERRTGGSIRRVAVAAAFEMLIVLLNSLPKEAFI